MIVKIRIQNPAAMKIKSLVLLVMILLAVKLNGQTTASCVTDAILAAYSERSYTTVPVTDQQLETILSCGIKTPSARNLQPWKFTVIKDEVTMREIIKDVVPGNVIVVISGTESKTGTTPDFDCGLATESMFLAAHGLGLGARIYGSPVGNINAKREAFQIPTGYKAVIVLRIGNVEKTVDGVSSATSRKKADEIVNYKK
jgi:nitroreductase